MKSLLPAVQQFLSSSTLEYFIAHNALQKQGFPGAALACCFEGEHLIYV
jgi:hypothetical protein